jgi:hypothetical protein
MPNAGTARCAPTFENNQSEKTFGNRYKVVIYDKTEYGERKYFLIQQRTQVRPSNPKQCH